MPFKKILRELVENVPGARGAILADWEGESVDQFSFDDEYEMKVVGAHLGIIQTQMKEVHGKLFSELPRESVITTDEHRLVVGTIGPEYSLVMLLDRRSVAGEALFRFRAAVKLLEKEIF